jgi:hypothetical protein
MSENNMVSILMEQISLLEKENRFLRAKIVEQSNDSDITRSNVPIALSDIASANASKDKTNMDRCVDLILKYGKLNGF